MILSSNMSSSGPLTSIFFFFFVLVVKEVIIQRQVLVWYWCQIFLFLFIASTITICPHINYYIHNTMLLFICWSFHRMFWVKPIAWSWTWGYPLPNLQFTNHWAGVTGKYKLIIWKKFIQRQMLVLVTAFRSFSFCL